MNPKCPDCSGNLVKEGANWYCEACDLEWEPEQLDMEEKGDGHD